MISILLPLLVSAIISLLSAYPAIRFAKKFNLIDDPKTNHHPKVIHQHPTPRGGGLAIFASILISSLVFIPLDPHLFAILLGASILVITGLIDDKYNLNPYYRLAIQFFAASIPIISGIGISFVTSPFGQGIIDLSNPQVSFQFLGETRSIWFISDLFALIWIVVIINFLNMGAKGVDGQLTGVVAIAAATIAALSLRFSADITEWPVIVLALITTGSFLGFLPWHLYPQKIMPSFSGSNLGGYMLGVLSILTTSKVGTLALVLGIPLIDTGYTILRRVASGKSPVWGDRGHLHHRLLDLGWSKSQVTYFYWAITAILGLIALNLNAESKLYTIIGISLALGGLILWLTHQQKKS